MDISDLKSTMTEETKQKNSMSELNSIMKTQET